MSPFVFHIRTLHTLAILTCWLLVSPAGWVLGQESGPDAGAAEANGGPIEGSLTKVSKGDGTLPNNHGQIWREYDISPYTARVTTTVRPEQAIVDWILRDTGTEVWFSDPVGMLSASREKLIVYNTPEMHDLVRSVVDRFVGGQAESHAFGLQLVTVGSPNWRSKALPLMRALLSPTADADAYCRYLAALHGIYLAVEPKLYAAVSPPVLSLLGVRPKLPALEQDLAALASSRCGLIGALAALPARDLPGRIRAAVQGEFAALGGLYVLEGATLGGRVIARRLRQQWGPESGMPFAFLEFRSANPGREWR